MRVLVWGLCILGCILLQATWFPILSYHGVKPDLLLVLVISAGLLFGKEKGISVGFFAGVFQDLASGNVFGVNTIPKMAIGYLFGNAERKVFKEHVFLPLIAVMIGTFVNAFIVYLYLAFFGHRVEVLPLLVNQVLPLVVYNMLVCIPIHGLVYQVAKKIEARNR